MSAHIKQQIENKLKEVMDPEQNISIVDLGLIYDVIVEEKKVKVRMTLTTIGCPLVGTIEHTIKEKLKEIEIDPNDVTIELTFDPPWSMDRISEEGKAMLGID